MRFLKRATVWIILFMANIYLLSSQGLNGFSYQAVIRDNAGKVINEGATVGLRFSILSGSVSGSSIYTETVSSVRVEKNGVVSLSIGATNQTQFNQINWAAGTFFLKTEIKLPEASSFEELGTMPFYSVPYAQYAKSSGSSIAGPKGDQGSQGPKGEKGDKGDPGSGSGGESLWSLNAGDNSIFRNGSAYIGDMSYMKILLENDTKRNVGTLRLFGDDYQTVEFSTYNNSGSVETYKNGVVQSDIWNGFVNTYGGNGSKNTQIGYDPALGDNSGAIAIYDENGKKIIALTKNSAYNKAAIALFDNNDTQHKGVFGLSSLGSSYLNLYGTNGKRNVALSSVSGSNGNSGFIGTYDENDQLTGALSNGGLYINGSNGSRNVSIGQIEGHPNKGGVWTKDENENYLVMISTNTSSGKASIGLYDGAGSTPKGSFFINSSGKSVLSTDELYVNGTQVTRSTSYAVESPGTRSASTSTLFVTEGNSDQIVIRGTSTLSNGKQSIKIPQNYQTKINPNSITVQVTPLSAISKGLAVVAKSNSSFDVAELSDGNGSYSFDWTYTALLSESALRSASPVEVGESAESAEVNVKIDDTPNYHPVNEDMQEKKKSEQKMK